TTLLIILEQNPGIIIEIGSHTDSKGSDIYNQSLSQRRAESVVKYLIGKGVEEERLQAKGYGETQFIAPNENEDGTDSEEGRALNRRTEFRIVGKLKGVSEIIYTR
ncbi:MAG: OOP family OmpA-OmpF porin, partial [Saprospiraceae bacterium]